MLDPTFTFDRFVLGRMNELAATAARRAAEAPGRTYNPLLICGRSGSGKTHLLHAIGAYALSLEPELSVHLESAQSIADRVTHGIAKGDLAPFEAAFAGLDILLVDEIEQVSGMERTQEELTAIAGRMAEEGRQLVLASVLPPTELPGLTPEFRRILDHGLVVEIGRFDVESRQALAARFGEEQGVTLSLEVLRAIASFDFQDANHLREVVGRLIEQAAAQRREPVPGDVHRVVGLTAQADARVDEFGSFLDDVSRTLAAVVETAPWRRRVAEAILRWEAEGIATVRLEEALLADTPPDVDALLDGFSRDAARLLQIRRELGALAEDAQLDNPDELARAEKLFAAAQGERLTLLGQPDLGVERRTVDPWFLNPEKVVLGWPDVESRLVEEPR